MRTYSVAEEAARAKRMNAAVKAWTVDTLALIKAEVGSLGVVDTSQLLNSLKYRITRKNALPAVASLKMKRHGIMNIHGVGRGVKAASANLSKRTKRDFYSGIIERQLPELEKAILEIDGDFILQTYPLGNNG